MGRSRRERRPLKWKMKKAIIDRDKGVCQLCFMPVDLSWEINWKPKVKYHFDHIIPFKDGGLMTIDNLRLTHPSCNLRRNINGMVKKRAIAITSPQNSIA